MTKAAIVLAALAALATAPPALAARAASAPPEAPGLLSIGGYEHALVQLSSGAPATADAVLVSRRQRIWRLPTGTAQRLLPALLARGVVQAVEPDRPVTLLRAEADPLASLEYWRPLVGADRVAPPGPGKAVTVLDTGIDLAHPEFAGRANTSVLGTQSLADTRTEFHGTAVSSIVGAQENGVGVVGVYPQAVVRSGDVRQLTVSQVIGALDAAIRAGPSVINMSFGVPYSRLFEDLVLTAFGAGSIVVAAAGNERQQGNTAASPANLNHVLTIAATDQQDRPTTFSTASLGVDLAAPGVDIPAAVPTAFSQSGYSLMAGTSFSAPIVTGATAWVWTVRAQLDNTQVFDLMRYSARDVAPQGFDRDTGFGLLDIPSALGDEAPSSDHQEPNDDIRHVRAGGLFGARDEPDHVTGPPERLVHGTARRDRGSRGRLPRLRPRRPTRAGHGHAGHRRRRRPLETVGVVRVPAGTSARAAAVRVQRAGRPARGDRLGPESHAERVLRVPRRLPAAERSARRGVPRQRRHRPLALPLHRRRRPLRPGDAGLAHAHPQELRLERAGQRVGDGPGQRLEQLELLRLADRADDVADGPVVDDGVDRVGPRLVELERDVEDERLTFTSLGLVDAVVAEHLEALDLHEHAHRTTAAATVSASTCSPTSCTRRIVAPRS